MPLCSTASISASPVASVASIHSRGLGFESQPPPFILLSFSCYFALPLLLRARSAAGLAQCVALGPLLFFLACCEFHIIQRVRFCRKPLIHHAYNNFTAVHRIKIIYICKMSRISSSFIICCSHPCLKCLNLLFI